ncbi:hypothetical protein G0U57_012443 [Chelydra serpentina]|uniref:Uncharacterized protein n=1 Tax=Chelydra serpentina TaxID=8475 RepID=A0A8T1RWE1_CHESE|nr:hypothetical protein G0U57_012443 [Chelydra serpentina]
MQRLSGCWGEAGQVAPEGLGSSGRLAQQGSGPSVPAGREEARGQARRRSSLSFWRTSKTPAPSAGPEAPSGPSWRWPRLSSAGEPGEGGSRASWLCGFLRRKQRSQEPRPGAQQQPSTILATAEPPAGPEQELGNSGSGTSSSAYSRGASSPSLGSDSPEAEGSLFEGKEDVSPEQATISVIQQHLQGRAEWVQDRGKQLHILQAVPRLCFSAQSQGRDILEPHFSKAALVESIALFFSLLVFHFYLFSFFSGSMAAVCSLSKLQPPLAREVESRLLRALLYAIYTMGTGNDTSHFRALRRELLRARIEEPAGSQP